jgi:hypothetical protein
LATRRGVYANFSQPSGALGALGIKAAVSLPGLWSMPSFMRKQAKSASRVQVEIIKKQLFPGARSSDACCVASGRFSLYSEGK